MAGAPNHPPVAQMESYPTVTCSICLETSQDPRTLPCCHSFCQCCLDKFVKGQREKAKGKVIELFNCPECRTQFEPKDGQVAVASLPAVAGPHNLCNTSIILNGHIEYVKQVVEWLGDQFQWRLCYRASVDGWKAQNFHTKCDNKGPTVTLVKVGEYIFGGYTVQNWAENVSEQPKDSFLFSLKNKDNVPPFKAHVFRKRMNISFSLKFGPPCFHFGPDLYISDDSHANQKSFTQFGFVYSTPGGYLQRRERTHSLLAGSESFTPTEIELFY